MFGVVIGTAIKRYWFAIKFEEESAFKFLLLYNIEKLKFVAEGVSTRREMANPVLIDPSGHLLSKYFLIQWWEKS